jgi:glyoxylase-like metal-dependent hydrolase (beta-lactamase superfamily II)
MEVRMFTVGPVQENTYLAWAPEGKRAVIVDPGDEPDKLLGAIDQLGLELEAILLTHTHFDHVGAVAPVARATGAPVYCPQLEVHILQDINTHMRFPGFGPFESWDPEQTVAGGETLQLAGLTFDVVFTPGHSIGHVTYVERRHRRMFSGDVLFEGSVGRTDLPGGDHGVLLESIQGLLDTFDDETQVLPGHMGVTSLGAERASNPFLAELPQR